MWKRARCDHHANRTPQLSSLNERSSRFEHSLKHLEINRNRCACIVHVRIVKRLWQKVFMYSERARSHTIRLESPHAENSWHTYTTLSYHAVLQYPACVLCSYHSYSICIRIYGGKVTKTSLRRVLYVTEYAPLYLITSDGVRARVCTQWCTDSTRDREACHAPYYCSITLEIYTKMRPLYKLEQDFFTKAPTITAAVLSRSIE